MSESGRGDSNPRPAGIYRASSELTTAGRSAAELRPDVNIIASNFLNITLLRI